MKYKVELEVEMCCDECGEVVHNHFDCPICKTNSAPTSIYHEVDISDKEISCESCGTEFTILGININELVICKKEY